MKIKEFGRNLMCYIGLMVLPILAMGQNDGMPSFELKSNDRVVFLGNGLMEKAQQYGVIETMFLSYWPDRKITFRNLGWSGDTVEGKARSYISKPPKPYDLLLQQIEKTKPSVVFLAYGGVESYAGMKGLETFSQDLNQLLDHIVDMGAEPILWSTLPQKEVPTLSVDLTQRKKQLEMYNDAMAAVANQRGIRYVDIYQGFVDIDGDWYETNGIHLNKAGYTHLAKVLATELDLSLEEWRMDIDVLQSKVTEVSGVRVKDLKSNKEMAHFYGENIGLPWLNYYSVNEEMLPKIKFTGLKRGIYSLSMNGNLIAVANHKQWAQGVSIVEGMSRDLINSLETSIVEINDLYFWEYRPLNRTYLVGMRTHEQGQNSYELAWNSLFINRLENDMFNLRQVEGVLYELEKVK
ncbi:hypothetical protein GCM10025777_30730 [Membranihabitans marinus]